MHPTNVVIFNDHKKIMNNLEFSKMWPNFFMTPLELDIAVFLITAIQPNPEQLWLFWGGGWVGEGQETVLTFPTIK